MQALKAYLLLLLSGAVLGAVLATVFAPSVISWYVTPGIPGTQVNVDMAQVAAYVISRFVRAQLTGAAIGAVIFVALGAVLRGGKKKAPPAPAVTSVPGGPTA